MTKYFLLASAILIYLMSAAPTMAQTALETIRQLQPVTEKEIQAVYKYCPRERELREQALLAFDYTRVDQLMAEMERQEGLTRERYREVWKILWFSYLTNDLPDNIPRSEEEEPEEFAEMMKKIDPGLAERYAGKFYQTCIDVKKKTRSFDKFNPR